MRVKIFFLLAAVCALVHGEGIDGPKDRFLVLPELDKCNKRFRESDYKGRNFFYSGNDPELKDKRLDWLDSRNTCRERCMETVTFDSQEKFDFFKTYIEKQNISFFWTSGRLCDFDGCEGRWDLLPKRVKGWLWSATQEQLADTNKTPPGWSYQPWSFTGVRKKPQPDNAEFYLSQTSESCIGILNNMYNDSIAFHDIACYHRTRFICEDSEALLQEAVEIQKEKDNEKSTTKEKVDEVESTSKRVEVERTTKRIESTTKTAKTTTTRTEIESENTSRRTKTVETIESRIASTKKPNQSDGEEPKKPQRRRKIVRKKKPEKNEGENFNGNANGLRLENISNESEQPENVSEKEKTVEEVNPPLKVEDENRSESEASNSTDDPIIGGEAIEDVETTTFTERTSSTTKSLFRNRGRRGRSRF